MNCIVDLDGVESDSSDDLPDTKYYQVQTGAKLYTPYQGIVYSTLISTAERSTVKMLNYVISKQGEMKHCC